MLICSNEQHDSFLCITLVITPVLLLMTVCHPTVPSNNVQLPHESKLPTSGCTVMLYGCPGRHRQELEALKSAHEATQEELVQRVAYLQVPHPPFPLCISTRTVFTTYAVGLPPVLAAAVICVIYLNCPATLCCVFMCMEANLQEGVMSSVLARLLSAP